MPVCRRRLGATGAAQRSTERGRSWTYTQTTLPPLHSGWVSNARILECSRLFSHGQACDRKPMVPRGVHGRHAKRGRHQRQLFVLRRLFALAVVQDLRRMRLHESCRRGIAAGNETVGSIAAEKAMRGERGYPISSVRRRQAVQLKKLRVRGNVRSELGCSSCELQSEQFVDFKFLASREMRNDVLGKLIVPFRASPAQHLVQPSLHCGLRPPAASLRRTRDQQMTRNDPSGRTRNECAPKRACPTFPPKYCQLGEMAGGLVGALLQTKFRRVEAGLHKRADGRLQAGLRSCRLLHDGERHPGRVRDRLPSAAQDGSPPALN